MALRTSDFLNAASAELKKLTGLDLRYDRRSARLSAKEKLNIKDKDE
jgi:hypothetical protein